MKELPQASAAFLGRRLLPMHDNGKQMACHADPAPSNHKDYCDLLQGMHGLNTGGLASWPDCLWQGCVTCNICILDQED